MARWLPLLFFAGLGTCALLFPNPDSAANAVCETQARQEADVVSPPPVQPASRVATIDRQWNVRRTASLAVPSRDSYEEKSLRVRRQDSSGPSNLKLVGLGSPVADSQADTAAIFAELRRITQQLESLQAENQSIRARLVSESGLGSDSGSNQAVNGGQSNGSSNGYSGTYESQSGSSGNGSSGVYRSGNGTCSACTSCAGQAWTAYGNGSYPRTSMPPDTTPISFQRTSMPPDTSPISMQRTLVVHEQHDPNTGRTRNSVQMPNSRGEYKTYFIDFGLSGEPILLPADQGFRNIFRPILN